MPCFIGSSHHITFPAPGKCKIQGCFLQGCWKVVSDLFLIIFKMKSLLAKVFFFQRESVFRRLLATVKNIINDYLYLQSKSLGILNVSISMLKISFALSPRFTKCSINKGRDVISSASETVECGHFATFPLSLWWLPCSVELMAPSTVDNLSEILSTELNKVVMVVAGSFPETLEP